jgi:hypothetical protein
MPSVKNAFGCWLLSNLHLRCLFCLLADDSTHWYTVLLVAQHCTICALPLCPQKLNSNTLWSNQQIRQVSSMIYWCIPNFTQACFRNSLPSSGGRVYLRSYSENICVVDVYGLQFVQCDQLSKDAIESHPSTAGHTGRTVFHTHPQHRYWLSCFWGKYNPLIMAMNCWNMLG